LVTAPFDLLKIRFQLQFADKVKYTSLPQAFATVIREEGFFSLWKGNLSATYLWIFYGVVQFATYGFLKNALTNVPDPFVGRRPLAVASTSSRRADSSESHATSSSRFWKTFMLFVAGAGAGIAATASTYPFDLIRTQFAIQGNNKVFTSMHSFISQTMRTKGITGEASMYIMKYR
jgi:solute carrier family 25 thiamine pyrophosphate transporter 19